MNLLKRYEKACIEMGYKDLKKASQETLITVNAKYWKPMIHSLLGHGSSGGGYSQQSDNAANNFVWLDDISEYPEDLRAIGSATINNSNWKDTVNTGPANWVH